MTRAFSKGMLLVILALGASTFADADGAKKAHPTRVAGASRGGARCSSYGVELTCAGEAVGTYCGTTEYNGTCRIAGSRGLDGLPICTCSY